eukprot:2631820-Amphidinium_carterae.1
MGFHGNLKKLWSDLDAKQTGFVTIVNLDPEVADYVGNFKIALLKKYGDMLTAWKQALDVNGTGRIEEGEVEAMRAARCQCRAYSLSLVSLLQDHLESACASITLV